MFKHKIHNSSADKNMLKYYKYIELTYKLSLLRKSDAIISINNRITSELYDLSIDELSLDQKRISRNKMVCVEVAKDPTIKSEMSEENNIESKSMEKHTKKTSNKKLTIVSSKATQTIQYKIRTQTTQNKFKFNLGFY